MLHLQLVFLNVPSLICGRQNSVILRCWPDGVLVPKCHPAPHHWLNWKIIGYGNDPGKKSAQLSICHIRYIKFPARHYFPVDLMMCIGLGELCVR